MIIRGVKTKRTCLVQVHVSPATPESHMYYGTGVHFYNQNGPRWITMENQLPYRDARKLFQELKTAGYMVRLLGASITLKGEDKILDFAEGKDWR